jgi:hypothetical protein
MSCSYYFSILLLLSVTYSCQVLKARNCNCQLREFLGIVKTCNTYLCACLSKAETSRVYM